MFVRFSFISFFVILAGCSNSNMTPLPNQHTMPSISGTIIWHNKDYAFLNRKELKKNQVSKKPIGEGVDEEGYPSDIYKVKGKSPSKVIAIKVSIYYEQYGFKSDDPNPPTPKPKAPKHPRITWQNRNYFFLGKKRIKPDQVSKKSIGKGFFLYDDGYYKVYKVKGKSPSKVIAIKMENYYEAFGSKEYINDKELPPAKQKALDHHRQDAYKARHDDIQKNDVNKEPDVVTPPQKNKTHKLPFIEAPVLDRVISFTNGWMIADTKDQIKGTSVKVEAGALKRDPQQGILVLFFRDYKKGIIDIQKHNMPSKHGIIKIKKQNGMEVILQAKDSTKWRFNIPSGKFKLIK